MASVGQGEGRLVKIADLNAKSPSVMALRAASSDMVKRIRAAETELRGLEVQAQNLIDDIRIWTAAREELDASVELVLGRREAA